jgi:hypothetical protein
MCSPAAGFMRPGQSGKWLFQTLIVSKISAEMENETLSQSFRFLNIHALK